MLNEIGCPSSGSISDQPSSSPIQMLLYAISTPNNMIKNDPITVYNMYIKKYRWFANPTQLLSHAVNVNNL